MAAADRPPVIACRIENLHYKISEITPVNSDNVSLIIIGKSFGDLNPPIL